MLDADTPRSLGYGSPRDDRFFTPRAHVGRSNSSTNSEEWLSPRFETPRYGETPRSQFGGTPRSQASDDYETPRTFETERVRVDRREVYPPVYRTGESPGLGAGRKGLERGDSYKESYVGYSRNLSPGPPGRRAESKQVGRGGESGHKDGNGRGIGNGNERGNRAGDGSLSASSMADEYEALPSGLSERDVEDVFSYARHGRVEEIEKLFAKGLPVDVRDAFGNTVLTIACQNGNKRVAKGVLRRGANINARNHRGNTPLHYTYHYGYGDSLGEYLVSKGADADARNNAGRTVSEGI
ncbi:ankyrin repeat-containing domain protein [Ochromonadaceae sp. CCMP2298]|nr:ankyrin repeat-containing domain protein [Ochromonadaceae sp. CCMP2298]|mmetsp:Transcript_25554/g.57768  ORF Transcript_25554/g.57768 Transcript_25554/m.57768 type:complete len:297 (-) Transcript_25554:430-1320(-)